MGKAKGGSERCVGGYLEQEVLYGAIRFGCYSWEYESFLNAFSNGIFVVVCIRCLYVGVSSIEHHMVIESFKTTELYIW